MKSRAPSGVDAMSMGVSTSTKPCSSIDRRMALLTVARSRRLCCMRGRLRSR